MRTAIVMLALAVLAMSFAGCSSTAAHSVSMNCAYLHDSFTWVTGLDEPTWLHSRDNIPMQAAEPYRAYD